MLEVAGPLSTPTAACGLELDTQEEVRDWLTGLCLDTIADSTREAEAAIAKTPAEVA